MVAHASQRSTLRTSLARAMVALAALAMGAGAVAAEPSTPVIERFYATPNPVVRGESVQVAWKVTGAVRVQDGGRDGRREALDQEVPNLGIKEVLAAPRKETVAQLAGFENVFDATVVALHEREGTMTCRLAIPTHEDALAPELEVPLGRIESGKSVRIGDRAGDILLATARPEGLSARNLLPGVITCLEQRDVTVVANVDCGVRMEVHVTPGAREALQLAVNIPVWLVLKTYSCHLLR